MKNFYPISIEHLGANNTIVLGVGILILYILIFGSELFKRRPKGFSKTQVIFSFSYGKKTKIAFIILAILTSFFVFKGRDSSISVNESGFTKTGIFGIKQVYSWNDFLSAKIKIGAVRENYGGSKYGGHSYCDARRVFIGFRLYSEKNSTVLYEETFYDLLPEDVKSTIIHDFIYDLVYFSKLKHVNIIVVGPDTDLIADDCKSRGITNPWDIQHSFENILKEAQSKS